MKQYHQVVVYQQCEGCGVSEYCLKGYCSDCSEDNDDLPLLKKSSRHRHSNEDEE